MRKLTDDDYYYNRNKRIDSIANVAGHGDVINSVDVLFLVKCINDAYGENNSLWNILGETCQERDDARRWAHAWKRKAKLYRIAAIIAAPILFTLLLNYFYGS